MGTVGDVWRNFLLATTHAQRRMELVERIPQLRKCSHEHFLSLFQYVAHSPQRFHSREVFEAYLSCLEAHHAANPKRLEEYIRTHGAELGRAFAMLREVNGYPWHDDTMAGLGGADEYELVRFIDKEVHPAYLKLVEPVFHRFAHLPAFLSRLDRGKPSDGLDVYNAAEELALTKVADLALPYEHIVRNAIAHGGVAYLSHDVRYSDTKGNEKTLDPTDIIALADDMLDGCNGAALALRVFLLARLADPYPVPSEVLTDELQAETEAPWWSVEGCLESQLAGRRQLIVYARTSTRDCFKARYYAMLTGVLAEYFAPGYDRYFISISSPVAWRGWAALDGARLNEVRRKGPAGFEDYRGVVEDPGVFYVPRPALPRCLGKLDTLRRSATLNWQVAKAGLGRDVGRPEIKVRVTEIHRNGWKAVVNGSAVVRAADGEVDQELLRRWCGRVLGAVVGAARRATGLANPARHLPLGFAMIGVYKQDHRRRRLAGYGLGPDLICTIRVQTIRTIRSPDILGSEIEVRGKYRIAWNRTWLDECGGGASPA